VVVVVDVEDGMSFGWRPTAMSALRPKSRASARGAAASDRGADDDTMPHT
jgi:hypothetical protein